MKSNKTNPLEDTDEIQRITKLESGYDHLENTIKDLNDAVVRKFDSMDKSIGRKFDSFQESMSKLTDTVNKKSQISWPLIVSLVVGGVAVLGFLHKMLSVPIIDKINNEHQVILSLAQDYKEHKDNHGHPKLVAEFGAEKAKNQTSFREIETQFKAQSHINNLREMHNGRIISLIWQRAYPDIKLPEVNYYPVIGEYSDE